MPRSKKQKPGNERTKKFETIFIITMVGLVFFLWILREFFQATVGQLLAVFLIGTLVVISVLRLFDRRAAEYAIHTLGRP